MKEYFYEKDNKAYIIDDEKGILIEDAKDNTEETLIVQNNIEEIEKEKEETKENKKNMQILVKSEKARTIVTSIVGIFGISASLYLGWETIPVFSSFVSFCYTLVIAVGFKEYIKHNRQIKMFKTYIKMLESELEKENQKLNTLKETAKNKTVDYTNIKEVSKSEIIENLNSKKFLIEDYVKNRKKYISSFKEDLLDTLLQSNNYNKNDIKFIKYLVEEDLKTENTNSKKKSKQKTKTL